MWKLRHFFVMQKIREDLSRVGLQHGSRSWTMKDGMFQFSNLLIHFHGPISSKERKKEKVTKPSGPSLGVNIMCTRRNEHAPKSECVVSFSKCPKKTLLKRKQIKFDHFVLFSCLYLLFLEKTFIRNL